MINVVTLFTGGISAIDFALKYEDIEFNHILACEIDKYARKQFLEFHGDPLEFAEDASKVCVKHLKGKVDLYCYGSPCQDLSLAGKRKGFDGEKSSLFREGARVLKEMMPKVFIFENVKGLLSSNGGDDYKEVVKTFQDIGYLIASKVVNAKEHGTAQNRERVFIVGFLDVDQYHNFNFAEPIKLEKRLKDYLESDVDYKHFLKEKTLSKLEFINGEGNQIAKIGGENSKYHNSITNRIFGIDKVCPTLTTAATGGNQQIKVLIPSANNDGFEVAVDGDGVMIEHIGSATGRGRVQYQKSQTLTTSGNQCVFIFGKVRKLTAREYFRLQGIKDEHINLVNSNTQSYKIAGNAIEVNTMRSIIRQLYKPIKPKGTLFWKN